MNTEFSLNIQEIHLHGVRDCLVVPLPASADACSIADLQKRILGRLKDGRYKSVLIDASSLPVIDRQSFEMLSETIHMSRMMGAPCVVAGIQPGAASALIDLGINTESLVTAADMDEGLIMLQDLTSPGIGNRPGL